VADSRVDYCYRKWCTASEGRYAGNGESGYSPGELDFSRQTRERDHGLFVLEEGRR